MREIIKQKLVDAMPTTYTTYVTLIASMLLILTAILLALLGKQGADTLLNYACLLLGIQAGRSAAVAITGKKEDSKVAVATATGAAIPDLPVKEITTTTNIVQQPNP